MNDRNIILTGFMGTGKTTVGRLVAEHLERPFVDTDAEIVKQAGKSIAEIFATEGEPAFRHIERRLCRFLAAQSGLVIATGGGMLVDAGNREVMLASGMVVCLMADPETILARLQDDPTERPLLRGDWRALLEQRRLAYEAFPCQVITTGKTPEQVADEVVQLWAVSV
ncbi:MAG: shikimate kinase [Chloroflexota bacterium]|nr:MAG: shikimate kinase [Chloroflexota bacterium]